jgi:hypothetical protein
MSIISATEILHAVPCGEQGEWCLLILKDGTCVRISVRSGDITSAFKLPDRDRIARALEGATASS